MVMGDVLAVIAGVVTACLSLWALLVGAALLFERQANEARTRLEVRPLRALGLGAALVITAGLVAIILINQPNGLLKLIGWILFLGLLALSALGGGGLALLVSGRIRGAEPRLSVLGALGRGAGLVVAAGLVPVLGWLLIMPLAMIATLGAGVQAVFHRTQVAPVLARSRQSGVEAAP